MECDNKYSTEKPMCLKLIPETIFVPQNYVQYYKGLFIINTINQKVVFDVRDRVLLTKRQSTPETIQ